MPTFYEAVRLAMCLVTSPDFEVMYRQTRSFESVPSRGMVTGPRGSGDVPVVDHPPPGSTRSVVTRVLQRLRPYSQRRTDRSGERSQRREASADRFASLLLLLLLLLRLAMHCKLRLGLAHCRRFRRCSAIGPTAAYTDGVVACRKNFLFVDNFFSENTQFGAENPPVMGKFRGKIKILSTRNICRKFPAVCRKIATSCCLFFLAHDPAGTQNVPT